MRQIVLCIVGGGCEQKSIVRKMSVQMIGQPKGRSLLVNEWENLDIVKKYEVNLPFGYKL